MQASRPPDASARHLNQQSHRINRNLTGICSRTALAHSAINDCFKLAVAAVITPEQAVITHILDLDGRPVFKKSAHYGGLRHCCERYLFLSE